MGLFTSLSRFLGISGKLVLPLTIALVVLIDGGIHLHSRKEDKFGPITRYILAAIHVAHDRVDKKLAAMEGGSEFASGASPWSGASAALDRTAGYADSQMNRAVKPESSLDKLVAPEEYDDPFVKKLPEGSFTPHPLLSYNGISSHYPFKKDYFGMRNDEDAYFGNYDPDKRCQILITWSGNSEAAGFTHRRTVAQYLEKELNQRDPRHVYKTLSLAVPGYAINDEIIAYVTLAYALKPEFSITHSGVSDVVYGGTLQGGFKQLGLIYTFDALYRWVDDIYGIKLVDNLDPNARTLQPSHMSDLIPGIIKTYNRFKDIVAGNGGELIIGLAPYGVPSGLNASAYWSEWAPQKLKELHDALPPGGFIDFTTRKDIEFYDTIHTTDKDAQTFAHVYADEILKRMKTKMLSRLRKGAPGYDGRSCKMPVEEE